MTSVFTKVAALMAFRDSGLAAFIHSAFSKQASARASLQRTRFAGSLLLQENTKVKHQAPGLVFYFGDPCGIRTRDLLDENQISWTTRRRGRV